ncbi:MAG: alpha/beta fold hydrolase, partial [Psychromonas sp.]
KPSPIITEKMTLAKDNDQYRLYEVKIDVGLNEFDHDSIITFDYYEQQSEAPSPVVILLPILNGKKHLMRPFASLFADKGYSVIIIDTLQGSTLLDDLKDPEPSIRKALQRHRRVIDWAESRDQLDISRLGVLGVSLGGFNALYLSALDKRVNVASIALAGGSLPDLLVNSDERRITEAVAGVKEDLSLDDQQLMEYLQQKIVSDTLVIAPHVNADRMLMVLAKYDKSVPYSNQLELYNAMGQPEAVTLPTGHNSAAIYIFSFRQRVLAFFNKKLSEGSKSGTAAISPDYCEEFFAAQE